MRLLIPILWALPFLMAQQPAPADLATFEAGKGEFEALCAGCHGADGAGGERGPGIRASRDTGSRSQAELRELIRRGIPGAGMPAFDLPEEQLSKLLAFSKSDAGWERGKSFYGGATREVPGQSGKKYLRAIDPQTGKIVWEHAQAGPANSWGGVLSTAGGLVFFGDDSGAFAAVNAKTGKPLWHFHTSQIWKASPMSYLAGGKQFVAIACGSNILAFGLPPAAK